jgi:hypothetical protein
MDFGNKRTSLRDVKALLGVDVPHFAGVLWVSRRMYLSLPEPCRPSSTFAQAQIRSPPCSLGEKLAGSPVSLRMSGELRPIFAHTYMAVRCSKPFCNDIKMSMSVIESRVVKRCGCLLLLGSVRPVVITHTKLSFSQVSVTSNTFDLLSVVIQRT